MAEEITKVQLDELLKSKAELDKRLADESKKAQEQEFKDNMKKLAEDIVKELHPQKSEKKIIFSGEPKENEELLTFGKFLQGVKNRDEKLKRGISEHVKASLLSGESIDPVFAKTVLDSTTSATAAYAVPIEYSSKIWGVVNNEAELPALFTEVPMTTRQVLAPGWLTGVSGGWTTEQTNGTTTNPTLRQVTLTLAFYRAIITQSIEFGMFNNVAMDQKMLEKFGEAVALALESQALVGSGSPFTGITGTSGTGAVTGAGNLTYDNMVNLRNNSTMKSAYHRNARFALSRASLTQIMLLKDDNKNPILRADGLREGMPPSILGRPYHITDQTGESATGIIIYGDFGAILKGRFTGAPDMMVDYSNVAVDDNSKSYWLGNMEGYRFNFMSAIAVADAAAFAKLTGFNI